MGHEARIKPIQILLVDDSRSDAFLTQEILSESGIPHQLHRVKDGVEALDFLYQRGKYTDVPTPDLILPDLNLPRKNGREVLAEIQADESLKGITVVVLTNSVDEDSSFKPSNLESSCYFVKPIELEQFITLVESLKTSG
ncbi:MAG: response regulator [Leptolyngbyaceae cyanobacterium HOT.MB2.61]|nr:response regulator [Leptolyngbyaceae cyanobacterium HOT.MB2.61]